MERKAHHKRPVTVNNNFDIDLFREMVLGIKQGNKEFKRAGIAKLLALEGLIKHQEHKITGRKVLSSSHYFDYNHERHTAMKLIEYNYDVIFAPKGFFKRNQKKFDVFIARDHIFLECDLKCIYSTNSDTIGNRIKEGSHQAARIVLDIHSAIDKKQLIIGLKTGCERNKELLEILLFYNHKFYRLPKTVILSNKLFDVIK